LSAAAITAVRPDQRDRALATLVLAFAGDPVERWLYPEPRDYLVHFPAFLAAFGGEAFERRTVWMLGAFSAVALWLPPGAEPDGQAVVDQLERSVEPGKHADLFAVLEQMQTAHPTDPHWYLPWLGVDPASQGGGLGGRLLSACLAVVDESRLPAYLETPNPRNLSFYRRHGFEVTGTAQAGGCPPVTFMLRRAAS
jgi:ribosomal protein S18 acetylase RimI-like enzyme